MILVLAKYIGVAFGGAIVTSYVEYRLNYNLYDTIKDKITSLFSKKTVAK